jgi:EmrB/QacA subfamily drug resistance transporter
MDNGNNENNGNLKWWILLTVIVGTFLGRLDQTIVNLALPKIIDDFGITVSSASWIATAYILANAVFVPVWGKLGDTIGRKKVYITGFALFIFGSILAGLAWDLNSMLLFRVIQAIAGSADYPTAMAILAVTFKKGKERAQALGIWSAAFAAAAVFGPLIGGPLIDWFGWRAVFLINLPVGIIGLAMAWIFVKESVSERPTIKFDWWGAITLGIALSSLVLVLDKGIDWGWTSSEALACYGVSMVFFYIFYLIDVKHPEPIVDFKYFTNSIFLGTLFNNFIVFMGMMGGIFILPIFAQTYLGYNATQTGILFMPMAAGMMLAAPLGGSLTGKVEPRWVIIISTLIAAFGLYQFTTLDVRSTSMDISVNIFIIAFGMGFGMAQRTNIIAAAVPENEIGIASSVLALVRNISGAFGIALFASIIRYSTEDHVLSLARNSIIHTRDPQVYAQVVSLIILKAQILAYRTDFQIAALILALGAIPAFFLKVDHKRIDGVEIHVE